MLSILGFLVILGPLVIVHEFGHYTFARIFGVKAEIFSLGFGPKLWSKVIGETEWRVSMIPMGGYVKLMGEDPSAQAGEIPARRAQARALHKQPAWKRFFIFFGGPFFNFIFAALIFMATLAIGEPQPASVVGRVVEGSLAQKEGLHERRSHPRDRRQAREAFRGSDHRDQRPPRAGPSISKWFTRAKPRRPRSTRSLPRKTATASTAKRPMSARSTGS